MATYTSNYAWTKPGGNDQVDISVLNGNLDSQDAIMHKAFTNMAPPFSGLSTYAVGDVVLYDNVTYKCHTAVTVAGAWTGSTNWQVYKLSEGGGGSSLTAGDYIDITAGVISVKKEKGEYSLERYVLQSTGGGAPKLVVKKYIDSELISTNEYANNTAHVNIDDTLEIWYSYNPYNWHYKLLVDGVDHSAGYEYEFSYADTTEYLVDFHIAAGDSTDLVTKGDLDYADLPNKPSINDVELSGNKTASDLGLQGALTFDNVPTDGSNNPVKSDGIYDALASKPDKTTTATGETLSLVPTSEGRALLHTAYGMSIQDGTPTPSEPVDIESAKADFTSTDGVNTQNVTTNLTLRAIEVSSTDNYNLVRDNKYYIADTLDYSEDNGWTVTRRVGEYEVLGTEGWNYVGDAGSKRVYIAQSSLGISAKSGATEQGYSSHFVYNGKTVSSITWGNYYFSGSNLVISANNSDITDITTAESWLSSNKPNFDYILVTPTTETITTEQALALLGLKTYDESTTISSQAEPACTIAVEYAQERLGALALTAYNMAKGNDLRITASEG